MATKKWENSAEALSVLVQAVRSAITYFTNAKNTRDRHIDNRQKAASKAAAKAKPSAAPNTSFGASKDSIFDINFADLHPQAHSEL